MNTIHPEHLNLHQLESVLKIWNNVYPKSICFKDIGRLQKYLGTLIKPHHSLVLCNKGNPIGWHYDFIRENEKWFGIIIHPHFQGLGLANSLIRKGQERNTILNGWVVLRNDYLLSSGLTYKSPIEFYQKLGFKVYPNDKSTLGKISTVKIQWVQGKQ